jgi:hypothetical protein
MSLAGQWSALGSELPPGWNRVELRLELRDREGASRAASLLGPAQPFRAEPTALRLTVSRDGTTVSPDNLMRLLRRLDEARIGGELASVTTEQAPARAERDVVPLAESWERALAGLPSDWSDLLCELELLSTDYIERAAVLCIQMNPRRDGNRPALQFRAARQAGYGVAPEMARRCFERCDGESIRGSVSVLRALSDTKLVQTQGPVWIMGGRTV